MTKGKKQEPIITVIGADQQGIVAQITSLLWEKKVNIEEIKQGIVKDNFFMIMVVDISKADISFEQLSRELKQIGSRLKLSISLYNKEIFEAINKI